jgi:hypothetical protein
VRNVGEPKVCQKFVAFIRFLGIGKRFTACVISYVVVSVTEMDHVDIMTVFRGSLGIANRQSFGNCRPHRNL